MPAAANLKSEVANDLQEADPAAAAAALEEKKPATITSLSFFNTYSPSKGTAYDNFLLSNAMLILTYYLRSDDHYHTIICWIK